LPSSLPLENITNPYIASSKALKNPSEILVIDVEDTILKEIVLSILQGVSNKGIFILSFVKMSPIFFFFSMILRKFEANVVK
jgi:hypothetical protein